MIHQSQILLRVPRILHAFSLRDPCRPCDGNTSFKFGRREEVLSNRAQLLRAIGQFPSHLVLARQEHGLRIQRVNDDHRGRGALEDSDRLAEADGLITEGCDLPLGVQVADCCCLLLADREGRAVGAFHAGWRGTFNGMALEAVSAFHREFQIGSEDLLAWIGPSISGRNYEVSKELWNQFESRWGPAWLSFDPYRVDLPNLNRFQLGEAGLPPENIEVSPFCTYDSPQCFSHRRRDRVEGRMMGVIAKLEA